MSKIALFVGCAPNGEDAESQMVLEYTARELSSMNIDLHWMKHSDDVTSPWHGWESKTWATPFSGFRWAIPHVADQLGYEQAIYMDSDMIINTDLAELWNLPWEDEAVIMGKGGWRFCVAKWNVKRALQILPPIETLKADPYSHQKLCQAFPQYPQLQQIFDRRWNNFDGENDPIEDIKIMHYTDMSTQPHAKYAVPRLEANGQKHWFDGEFREHRRQDIQGWFDTVYNEALTAGYTVEQYIPDHVVAYTKESQKGYTASNGFDVTEGQ